MGKSDEETRNLPQILRALNLVCFELDLIPIQNENYVPESSKWTVVTQKKNSQQFFVLEFFEGLHRGLRFKFLDCSHLLGFDFMRRFDGIHCFGYKCSGSVPDLIARQRTVQDKELNIAPILENVLGGMFLLSSQRLWHQRLTMEHFRMLDDGQACIGDLELVMPEGEVRKNTMAPIPHLPPELLTFWTQSKLSLAKAQMWILGSQILELLIDKHISGEAFHPHDPMVKLTRRRALKNIRRNVRYLPYVLAASDLSFQMQDFLAGVLTANPDQRMNVLQALMYFGKCKDYASMIAD